jgi:hypothetical protein
MGFFVETDQGTAWVGHRVYHKPDWPLQSLELGAAVFIPLDNGVDQTGRDESLIRAYVGKYAKAHQARFHVHRVEGGLAIVRSSLPYQTRVKRPWSR